MTPKARKKPVRSLLVDTSALLPSVKNGLGAMKSEHVAAHILDELRPGFADSLDLDAALQPGREQQNRWDYLLGHTSSGEVIALEPHSAKDDEVRTIIAKRKAAREQLTGHLAASARIAKWFWVASGKVRFADTEKARRQLDQHGIEFIGTRLLAKHLADLAPSTKKKWRRG